MYYTYLIGWTKLDRWYYGAKFGKDADPARLWTKYKTSSKYVTVFAQENGDPDVIQVRKTFTNKKKCMLWEHKVLKRMKVVYNDRWLNKSDNMVIDYFTMKKNTKPGLKAINKKRSKMSWDNFLGEQTAEKMKQVFSENAKANWANTELRERLSKKPDDRSNYKKAAYKRWEKLKAEGYKHPPITEETRKRKSEASKKGWEKRRARGKSFHSDETKQKISLSGKNAWEKRKH